MAISFTYTEATNTVVVTEGTVGTPATPVNFVTFDRAGTATLLVATAGLSPTLALTYQIRPVDVIALLITFTVASKTAQADFIFITGTDWRGAAQTESIDVTAGNGAYVSTKYFRTITNIDCSDNAAGGGTQWADGTVAVTQPQWGVIWDYGTNHHVIDANFNIGNGGTATYFACQQSTWAWSASYTANMPLIKFNADFNVTANATFRFGAKVDSENTKYGGGLYINYDGICDITGTLLLYGSTIVNTRHVTTSLFSGGAGSTIEIINCVLDARIVAVGTAIAMTNCVLSTGAGSILTPAATTNTLNDIIMYNGAGKACLQGGGQPITVSNLKISASGGTAQVNSQAEDITLIDSTFDETTPSITIVQADDVVTAKKTCNIHIADKDGVNLAGVTVDCEDINTDAVWAAGTIVTDANGDIVEQIIAYKTWTGTSETLATLTPHKFTLSKAGYETLVLDNVTVDGPIVWHLEMLPAHGAWPKVWR